MRVLYHHRTRGRGAEGVHIRSIVKALRERGHVVDIVGFPGADPELQADSTAPVSQTPGARGVWGWLADLSNHVPEWCFEVMELGYNILAVARVRRALGEQEYDAIYERYSLFMCASLWLARRRRLPLVLEVNDSALVERVRPLSFRRLARRMERYCFRRAAGLVFISERFQNIARDEYGSIAPSVVSPNGADLEMFHRREGARVRIREELGLTDSIVCGYVGAFIPWHGIDWFVERAVPILRDNPRLALLLVGDGVTFESVSAVRRAHGLESQIAMTGRVRHEEVPDYLSAMDFGVLPNANEYQSPLKLFESMAVGCPMLCPDTGPIKEVVEDGETGWHFPNGDRDACVNSVRTLLSEGIWGSVGRAAAAYIESERQWVHNADQFLALIQPLPLPSTEGTPA